MKLNLMNTEVLRKFSKLQLIRKAPYFLLLLLVVCCKKENLAKNDSKIKNITLNKLFEAPTYTDHCTVYTNDSLFCIYLNDNYLRVWKNGSAIKNSKAVLSLIKENNSLRVFKTYKYQSEFMRLDYDKYKSHMKDKSTKDYKIINQGMDFFLIIKGYQNIKIPINNGNDMDWITFNSMDINNDKIPELFIFHRGYDSKTDEEFGYTKVYEVKK